MRKKILLLIASVIGMIAVFQLSAPRTTDARAKPVLTSVPKGMDQATFAGGCFWSMQAIFQQLNGVRQVVPGYAGGKLAHPSYEQVETGTTGHAETINIVFDPKVIRYKDLVKVLLIARDPTTLNKQGPDEGPQYRSVIFTRTAQQKQDAEAVIAEVAASRHWPHPIVTKVEAFQAFYPAEDYHFDYYNQHPNQPYCALVIAPEIAAFRKEFAPLLKK